MANKLSDLGGSIFVDGENGERQITLIADANVKAGWIVGQTTGNVTARGSDVDGTLDETDGIMKEHYSTDLDSAPGAGALITVVVPKSGRRYRVAVYLAATTYAGEPMSFAGDHDGMMSVKGNIEAAHQARLSKGAASGDNFAEVVWGA